MQAVYLAKGRHLASRVIDQNTARLHILLGDRRQVHRRGPALVQPVQKAKGARNQPLAAEGFVDAQLAEIADLLGPAVDVERAYRAATKPDERSPSSLSPRHNHLP